jgi:hypothetical protein
LRWIAPVPRQRSGLEGNRERVPSAKKKAPAKRGEGWYPECGLKESESTTVPCHTDLQIAKFLLWNSLRFILTVGSAVSPYRSKFADCMAGAVPNSYPKLDLLWDNVIAGPWGTSAVSLKPSAVQSCSKTFLHQIGPGSGHCPNSGFDAALLYVA